MTTTTLTIRIILCAVIGTLFAVMLFMGSATVTHAHEEDEHAGEHVEEDQGFFNKPFFKRGEVRSEDEGGEDGDNDNEEDNKNSFLNRESLRADIEEKRRDARAKLEARKEKLEEKRAEIREKREERRTELAEKSKERIRAYIGRIEHRFEAAIKRLEKISERILSRIEKFEDQGKNMDVPRELLDEAQGELETARIAIELFVSEALIAVNAEEPKIAFASVRELTFVAKSGLKNAHRALVNAIIAIKAERGDGEEGDEEDSDDNDNATTTDDQ